uniref:Uncharacterized protein n=1 Tax=Oryza rufipogon TaxID=4529 RepID=A0A0E0QGX6_ORYRU
MRKGQGRHDATEVAPELEERLCRHGWAASVAVVARNVAAVREPTTARLAVKVLLDVGPILDSFEPRANLKTTTIVNFDGGMSINESFAVSVRLVGNPAPWARTGVRKNPVLFMQHLQISCL